VKNLKKEGEGKCLRRQIKCERGVKGSRKGGAASAILVYEKVLHRMCRREEPGKNVCEKI